MLSFSYFPNKWPMSAPTVFLLALVLAGAALSAVLARYLERLEPARLARGFLIGVMVSMGIRVLAYVAANVFGAPAVRPISTGPYDPTNLLLGAVYGLALVHSRRGGFASLWRETDVLLALRLSAGIAFVLAGLVNAFHMDAAVEYFIQAGYSRTFRLFIMAAEVLGGAALLLPWPWLTLTAAAGLTVDMFGALSTQIRTGDALDPAAIAMLLRIGPLVALAARPRWTALAAGAFVCAVMAVLGSLFL